LNWGKAEKGTEQDDEAEGSKGNLKNVLANEGRIHQDRTNCAAGGSYQAVVPGMPFNTHHRCGMCNYCLHDGNCGIEQKEREENKVPFSQKAFFLMHQQDSSRMAHQVGKCARSPIHLSMPVQGLQTDPE
jgi:hypothetical protein